MTSLKIAPEAAVPLPTLVMRRVYVVDVPAITTSVPSDMLLMARSPVWSRNWFPEATLPEATTTRKRSTASTVIEQPEPLPHEQHVAVLDRARAERHRRDRLGHLLAGQAKGCLGGGGITGEVGVGAIQPLAAEAQAVGIEYYGMRNEQAASYAAQAVGYLTGRPGVCITVCGPGVVHGLAGLANAQQNCWPMIGIGGASPTYQNGMGGFQEERQVQIASPFCKFAHAVEHVHRPAERPAARAATGRRRSRSPPSAAPTCRSSRTPWGP